MALTVKQAADLAGVSKKTIMRRIRDGSLPAQKVPSGAQSVWNVDQGDLAAWAQSIGQPLRNTGHAETASGDPSQAGADTAGDPAPATGDTDRDEMVTMLRDRIAALEAERDWLRGHVDTLTWGLPAPAGPDRRGWWQRLWGRE